MYKKTKYKGRSVKEIKKNIIKEGFDPIAMKDSPGRVYSKHSHPETKLLVILEGGIDVKTGRKKYKLQEGDELIIPGNQTHSAVVGEKGCKFFWSQTQ
jgi:quercetin dioxygenase-like cupin family protein